MAEMENMVTRCPDDFKCETYVIGQSFEGREQKILKVEELIETVFINSMSYCY